MVKSRKTTYEAQIGHYRTIPTSPGPVLLSGEDSVMRLGDSGNYGYPNFPPDRDVGQKFFLNSYQYRYDTVNVGSIRSGTSRYIGSFRGSAPGVSKYTDSSWSPSAQDCYRAYNTMKPAQSDFEGINALFELKDLPGMVRQLRGLSLKELSEIPYLLREQLYTSGLKNVGKTHLAVKFGWVPLLRDICNLVDTQIKMQKRLAQLVRDNGKPVRRRIDLRSSSDTEYSYGQAYGAFAPTISTGFYQGFTPVYKNTITTSEKLWASAQFRYWLPEGPRDVDWTNRLKSRILGSDMPSPKDVWNAMPWTWLTDWFVDVGSMLKSLDTDVADRIAADYLYIMRELSIDGMRETTGYFRHDAGDYFYASAKGYVYAKVKCRDRGTPYGWNVNESLLSGTQLGILGALGLSRL